MAATPKNKPIEYTELPIGDIQDLHPCLISFENKWSIPVFKPPLLSAFTAQGLFLALKNHPIYVSRSRLGYRCIGNVRMYRLAKMALGPEAKVSVSIAPSRPSQTEICKRYLAEFFLLPAIHHLSNREINLYYELWQKFRSAQDEGPEKIKILRCPTQTAFRCTLKST